MQCEVQRVVEVVIEVRTSADHEVNEAAIHQLDDAAAEPGRRPRAGDGQSDGRVVLGGEHLVRKNPARLADAGGVEGLEALVNELTNVRAAARPVVPNLLA